MPEPILYTRKETCELLRIGMTTFQKLVNLKQLRICRIGGKVLVPRAEIARITRVHASHFSSGENDERINLVASGE